MCKPKTQGGLGIKNPHNFNIALLTKLASRVMTENDQLWVKLLEAKYFHGSNPFQPTRNYELSWIWISIQKGLNIIKGNYIWKVKDGTNTKIWEDNWIPNADIVTQPSDMADPLPQKVHELLNTDGSWDIGKIDEYFTPEIKNKILAITPHKDKRDRIRWKHHISGAFSAKNVYNYLINQNNNDEEDIIFPWKNLWNLQAIPRIRLFIWKLVQKALPTNSRLAAHNSEISAECPLCDNQVSETENHLFRKCHFARSIWFGCDLNTVNSQINTNSIVKWVEIWISDPKYSKICEQIATIIWFLWKYRCEVIFRKINPDPFALIQQIKKFLQAQPYNKENLKKDTQKKKATKNAWNNFNADWIIFTDASFNKENLSMGYAFILYSVE